MLHILLDELGNPVEPPDADANLTHRGELELVHRLLHQVHELYRALHVTDM